jgi:putative Holliday junction resolvase
MNILGIDYGEKRIGLALGGREIKIATPYEILENKNLDFVIDEIKKICKTENVNEIIVGLPISLKGKIEAQAKKVLEFVEFLKKNLEIPIETEDERLTSVMVDKLAKEQKVERDAVAAMLILQSYLDRHK